MKLLISRLGGGTLPDRETEILLRRAVKLCLMRMKAGDAWAVGLTLTDDRGIRELNRAYRGLDQPTDVLSFPSGEGQPGRQPEQMGQPGRQERQAGRQGMRHPYLGDVVVSTERAAEQAGAYGHSFTREMAFLTVHGALHLLGLDHEIEGERLHMEKLQRQILWALGVGR
ncbi:MAG: rRNA maturation RNase YbeY [Clostridiales bacterium]|nr:rRNA maturation RNase YbeY [Clostridiales bacterium]